MTAVVVCGLNGAGKSTLAKALAAALGFYYIDAEALFFEKTDGISDYTAPCSPAEAAARLRALAWLHGDFVLAAVKADWAQAVLPVRRYAVLVKTPQAVRMQRLQSRAAQQFGGRAQPGGDLYAREQAFLAMAAARQDAYVEDWTGDLRCPVLPVDGTRPTHETVARIVQWIQDIQGENDHAIQTDIAGGL